MSIKKSSRECCGGIRITLAENIQIKHSDMPGIVITFAKEAFAAAKSAEDCALVAEKGIAEAGVFLSLNEHAEIGKTIFALLNE